MYWGDHLKCQRSAKKWVSVHIPSHPKRKKEIQAVLMNVQMYVHVEHRVTRRCARNLWLDSYQLAVPVRYGSHWTPRMSCDGC
jgi:hypothetical protein